MARSFNGTSDYIHMGFDSSLNPSGSYSVCAWARMATFSPGVFYAAVSSRNIVSSKGYGYILYKSGDTNRWSFWQGVGASGVGAWHSVDSAITPTIGAWYHLLGTWDGTNQTFYVNGTSAGTGTTTFGANAARETRIGAGQNESTPSFYFKGDVSGVAIWNRALSAGDAISLASGLPPSHLGPSHYWPFWGVDSPEPDIGNG